MMGCHRSAVGVQTALYIMKPDIRKCHCWYFFGEGLFHTHLATLVQLLFQLEHVCDYGGGAQRAFGGCKTGVRQIIRLESSRT